MFRLTAATLARAQGLFGNLVVRPEVMLRQFDDSDLFVMTEAVMMEIAPKLGRTRAYDLLKSEIKSARPGISLKELIENSPKLLELVGASNIARVVDPANYLGAAPEMVDKAVAMVRTSTG